MATEDGPGGIRDQRRDDAEESDGDVFPVRQRVIAVGAYVGVSAIVGFVAGFADREWLLVWSLGLVFLLGWRNRQPVLRALYDWLPLLVILAVYDLGALPRGLTDLNPPTSNR